MYRISNYYHLTLTTYSQGKQTQLLALKHKEIDGLKLIRTVKFNAVPIANKNTAKPNDCFDLQCVSQHF